MEIDSVIPPVNITVPQRPALSADPYVADLLKIADDKVAELTELGRVHAEEREGYESRFRHLNKQVSGHFYGVSYTFRD